MPLQPTECPSCGAALTAPHERIVRAHSYFDCLRKCEPCGIGFSNAAKNPTIIFRDHLDNVPAAVRSGAFRALSCSLNVRNRGSKREKFRFSTSEDAVTWTVFSYLIAERPQALITLGKRWLGTEVDEPTMLLWGCPIPPTARGAAIRERLIQISDLIGESPTRRTEPDVVFDFAQNGLVFIEVKLSSKNEKLIDTGKMHRYLSNTNAFSSPRAIKQSGLYQLTRNWRFGWDLAGERPFRLVNLAPLALFTESGALGSFEHGLCRHTQASFIREAWEDMLSELGAGLGGLPPWLSAWLNARQLMPPGGRRAEEGPAQ